MYVSRLRSIMLRRQHLFKVRCNTRVVSRPSVWNRLIIGHFCLLRQLDNELRSHWSERLSNDNYAVLPTTQAGVIEYTVFAQTQNAIQHRFMCCGVRGVVDYSNAENANWPKQDFVCCLVDCTDSSFYCVVTRQQSRSLDRRLLS